MRKRIVSAESPEPSQDKEQWLALAELASVEVTSEDPNAPIEAAFAPDSPTGWRAAKPGEQTIRLLFDSPQTLHRVELLFVEDTCERAQEFVLRYATDDGSLREVVRQQFNFSPGGTSRELENFSVALTNVKVLELHVIPDRSGGNAVATLARMRVA